MRGPSGAIGIFVSLMVAMPARAQFGPERALDEPKHRDVTALVYSADFDGTDYFVVWNDARHDGFPSVGDVYGARVSPLTGLVDLAGIAIAVGGAAKPQPRVAFTRDVHLVVWQVVDGRSVYTARVRKDGTVLEPNGVLLSNAATQDYDVTVAASGDLFLVCWADGSTIQCVRLTPDGLLLDAVPLLLSTTGKKVSAASDGTDFLVVWVDTSLASFTGRRPSVTRVLPDGTVTNLGGVPVGPDAFLAPTSAWFAAGEYLVAFVPLGGGVDAVRVSQTGALLDPSPLAVGSGFNTTIGFDGTVFLVGWSKGSNFDWKASVTGVTTDGHVLPSASIASGSNIIESVVVASGTTGAGLFWSGDSVDTPINFNNHTVLGVMMSSAGNLVGSPFLVSAAINTELTPSLASWRGGFIAGWLDRSPPPWRAIPSAVTLSSTTINGAPVSLPPSGSAPIFATDSLVVRNNGTLQAGFVDQDAGPGSVQMFSIGPAADEFAAAGLLVVWSDSNHRIVGARVDPDAGALDSPPIAIGSNLVADQEKPTVAKAGSRYLVAWAQPGLAGRRDVVAQWVTSDGITPGRRDGGMAIAGSAEDELAPDVADDGQAFFIVYEKGGRSIEGRRVDESGAGPVLELASAAGVHGPRVARVGKRWLVVWTMARDAGSDIAGAWVDLDADGGAMVLELEVTDGGVAHEARVAGDATGAAVILYQRYVAALDAERLFVRQMGGSTTPTMGTSCASAGECASGFCVDGVCCDSACGQGDPSDCMACAVSTGGKTNGTCSAVVRGRQCRGAASVCDAVEICDGLRLECPADELAPDGAVCDDGDPSTQGDRCAAGHCAGDPPSVCAAGATCGSATHRCGCSSGSWSALALGIAVVGRFRRRKQLHDASS